MSDKKLGFIHYFLYTIVCVFFGLLLGILYLIFLYDAGSPEVVNAALLTSSYVGRQSTSMEIYSGTDLTILEPEVSLDKSLSVNGYVLEPGEYEEVNECGGDLGECLLAFRCYYDPLTSINECNFYLYNINEEFILENCGNITFD